MTPGNQEKLVTSLAEIATQLKILNEIQAKYGEAFGAVGTALATYQTLLEELAKAKADVEFWKGQVDLMESIGAEGTD
jgi:hypothetical protein